MIGNNLRKIRRSLEITQSQLAKKLAVAQKTICRWELGHTKIPADTLIKITKIFNIPIEKLLDEKNIKSSHIK